MESAPSVAEFFFPFHSRLVLRFDFRPFEQPHQLISDPFVAFPPFNPHLQKYQTSIIPYGIHVSCMFHAIYLNIIFPTDDYRFKKIDILPSCTFHIRNFSSPTDTPSPQRAISLDFRFFLLLNIVYSTYS